MTDEAEPETVATAQVHAELYTWLRHLKPQGVVIVTKEGKRQPIALRTGKSRWTIAARVVVRMLEDVERVEGVDKRGATLDSWTPSRARTVVDADDGDVDLAGLGALAPTAAPRGGLSVEAGEINLAFAAAVVKLVQTSADHQVDRHDRSTRELMNVLTENQRVMTLRVTELEKTLGATLKAIYDATRTRAEVEGWAASATKELARRERDLDKREAELEAGGGGDMANLDRIGIEFLRHRGILPPAAPTNGANGHAGPSAADTIGEDDL